MAHHVDARYDESDGVFLPPLRTLGFNPQLTLNDSLLVHSYIEAYDISYPEALRRIENEVAELRQHLETAGSYELNDIGVLSLNEEGNLQFEPCEAGILSPMLYGLGAFEMKPLKQKKHEPVSRVKEEKPVDHAIIIKMSWLRNIAAVAAAVIAFLMLPGTPVSNSHLPNETQQSAFIPLNSSHQPTMSATHTDTMRQQETAIEEEQAKDSETAVDGLEVADTQSPLYTLVLASQVSKHNAEAFVDILDNAGFDEARMDVNKNNVVRVVYGTYTSEQDAVEDLRQLRTQSKHFHQAWVMKME